MSSIELADLSPRMMAFKPPDRRLPEFRPDSPWLVVPAVGFVGLSFLVPLGIVLWYSLHKTSYGVIAGPVTLDNYLRILGNPTYAGALLRSMGFVAGVAALTVAAAFPFAYYVAVRLRPNLRTLVIVAAALPFFTSYLARVIAWLNIFGTDGILNRLGLALGLLEAPAATLGLGTTAVVATFVYLLAPLAFLTLYASLTRIDPSLIEAASDLGARRRHLLMRIILPTARDGIIGSFAFVFIALFGDYITPMLLGGTDGVLFVNLLVNQFGASMQWGFGTAMAVTMLIATLVMLGTMKRLAGRSRGTDGVRRFVAQPAPWLAAYAGLFLAFLYAPIALLLLFALNDAETVGLPMRGLTLRWFEAALANQAFMAALVTSLKVALVSAFAATLLGSLAAIPLARHRGRWRWAAMALLAAPMLLPPVVLGTGILISAQAIGLPRSLWTIIAGHTLLAVPVATLITLARLDGIDGNQELAAMDLGARPLKALGRITAPQILPAIVASLLLSFALSLDEFILTFLITGTDSTLPLYIYGSIRFRMTPAIVAGASLILIASAVAVALGAMAAALVRRHPKKLETAHAVRA